ncbi:MAG: BlaI/MecI/CopY family transcriptional regulator [Rhodothermales bacterium]|nr:BlaI/MecI/CopY family transcriptional regulator [Rhodothermales bacterium]
MARKKSKTLTDAELRLMRIVWKLESCTVNDVLDALPVGENLAYSTVLTTMRILEEKGYVRHDKEGRAYVYEPIVDRDEAQRDALHHLMGRFFNNSPGQLVANLLEDDDITEDHLTEIRSMLADRNTSGDSRERKEES